MDKENKDNPKMKVYERFHNFLFNKSEVSKNKRSTVFTILISLIIFLGVMIFTFGPSLTKRSVFISDKDKIMSSLTSLFDIDEDRNKVTENYLGFYTMLEKARDSYSLKSNLISDTPDFINNYVFPHLVNGLSLDKYSSTNTDATSDYNYGTLNYLKQIKRNPSDKNRNYSFDFGFSRSSSKKTEEGYFGLAWSAAKIFDVQYKMNENDILINTSPLLSRTFDIKVKPKTGIDLKTEQLITRDIDSDGANLIKKIILDKTRNLSSSPTLSIKRLFLEAKLSKILNEFKDKLEIKRINSKSLPFNGKKENFDGYQVKINQGDLFKFIKDTRDEIFKDEKIKASVLYFPSLNIVASSNFKKTYDEAYTELEGKINKVIDDLSSYNGLGDIETEIYLNNENKILSMNFKTTYNNDVIKGTLDREGGDFISQNALFNMTREGEKGYSLKLKSSGITVNNKQERKITLDKTVGNDTQSLLKYENNIDISSGELVTKLDITPSSKNWKLGFFINGGLHDVTKDSSFVFNIGKVKLDISGNNIIDSTGNLSFRTDKMDLGIPLNELVYVSDMAQNEFTDAFNKIRNYVNSLEDLFKK